MVKNKDRDLYFLAMLNLFVYLIELTFFLLILFSNGLKIFDDNGVLIPLYTSKAFFIIFWVTFYIAQSIFVFRGLPFCKPSLYYNSTLQLRIKGAFALQCVALIASMAVYFATAGT